MLTQTQVLTSQDISRNGFPQALQSLNEQAVGASLSSVSGNPFEPTLFYHGFQAAPLQGTEEASRSTSTARASITRSATQSTGT